MALTEKHVKDVCCNGDMPNMCRYLHDEDVKGKIVFVCKKLSSQKKVINQQIAKAMKEPMADLNNVPLGDNCQGYIDLKTTKQGYDV